MEIELMNLITYINEIFNTLLAGVIAAFIYLGISPATPITLSLLPYIMAAAASIFLVKLTFILFVGYKKNG